jgi:precorrin-6A/cobalt-precorrin-6A reductase
VTRILVLGGTGDALKIARRLKPEDIYSLAGLGKIPDDLACHVRVGGFGGSEGLVRFLEDERIGLIVDATHPYAAQMSANAAAAGRIASVGCWALRRSPWEPCAGDDWRFVSGWDSVLAALTPFVRPLFTLGREPLAHLAKIPTYQYWTIRCLDAHPGTERASIIGARGPFTLEGERALFEQNGFDVIVSKNSGGTATEAKLEIARELRLPIVMLRRPRLPDVERIFETTDTLLAALETLRNEHDARLIRPGS